MATKKPTIETPAPAEDKKKALETALKQIEKSFGKGPSCAWVTGPR